MEFFAEIAEQLTRGRPLVLVTVVDTRGSTPRKAGARMAIGADGTAIGTIGGGTVEHRVTSAALALAPDAAPQLIQFDLTRDLGMCCGGSMTFFMEILVRTPPLFVFGCGHVGRALIEAALPLGFEIIAIDDLQENLDHPITRRTARQIDSYAPADLAALPFGPDAYAVIATREHATDQRLIELCLAHPWHYLGVIGSMRKAQMQRERLLAHGFTPEIIATVTCPIGLDIGAQSPAEIAIAICAELIAERHAHAVVKSAP